MNEISICNSDGLELQIIHYEDEKYEYIINMYFKDERIEKITCRNGYGALKMFIQLQIDYFGCVYYDQI